MLRMLAEFLPEGVFQNGVQVSWDIFYFMTCNNIQILEDHVCTYSIAGSLQQKLFQKLFADRAIVFRVQFVDVVLFPNVSTDATNPVRNPWTVSLLQPCIFHATFSMVLNEYVMYLPSLT